jgi:hypothetical protein
MTFSLAYPWLLIGAAALPALWLVLRLLPPPTQRVRLPTVRLIDATGAPPPPVSRPPLWLILLRIGIVALALAGLAGPSLRSKAAVDAPSRLVVVVDNGWSAASQWPRLLETARRQVSAARTDARIAIIPTAANAPLPPIRFTDRMTALAALAALQPRPWAGDRAAAAGRVPAGSHVLWIADGVESRDAEALRSVARGGEIAVVSPADAAFRLAGRTREGWAGQLAVFPAAETTDVTARQANGIRERQTLPVADGTASFRLRIDAAARRDIRRLTSGTGSAGATYLADAGGLRPRVLLVDEGDDRPPLESGNYYVRRALEPYAEVARASLADAARDPASLVIFIDVAATDMQAQPMLDKVRRGAVAVLFAGPRVAGGGSALSPVALRSGARALGGAFAWQSPQPLGGFAEDAPFAGLVAGPDTRVSRQLLADPGAQAARWAWLADGTPIVSARREGVGLLVLVHTAADPSWSSLPLTGLFETMLRRLLPLAFDATATDIAANKPWQLEFALAADGTLLPPQLPARIQAQDFDSAVPSAATPPGIYRSGETRRALNISQLVGPRFAFVPLAKTGLSTVAEQPAPIDLGRWLLLAAALLALADIIVAMRLRGMFALASLAAVLLSPGPVRAADLQLAFVRSGNATIDARTARGLEELGRALARRTAVAPGPPAAVEPGRDRLGAYPLLYWPAQQRRGMSPAAAVALRAYVARGGLVLFDFGRPLGADSGARALLAPLGLPALAEVGPRHVLARSFYILKDFAGGAVWVEAGSDGADGRVSGVIIGGGDWSGLWSGVTAADPRARELGLRFGINVVMYALTGTYKADQVHASTLLERFRSERPR